MDLLIILLVLLLLFGGGYGWTARPSYAGPEIGGLLGLLFVVVLIVMFLRLLGAV